MRISVAVFALLIFLNVFTVGKAFALSCVNVEGDQVLSVLDHVIVPLWFGKATLISTDQDSEKNANVPFTASFQVDDTYLTVNGMPKLEGQVDVKISNFHQTWGIWSSMDSVEKQVKVGSSGEYVFAQNDKGQLDFYAPGGCTYFSKDEWAGLKSGGYKKYADNDDLNCENATTQLAMNQCAAISYRDAENDLNADYYKALKIFGESDDVEAFKNVQGKWLEYRDLNCDYVAGQYEGGSIKPLIYASCMDKLTRNRSEDIRNSFAEWESK